MRWLVLFTFLTHWILEAQNLQIALIYDGPSKQEYGYFSRSLEEIKDLIGEEYEITYKEMVASWSLKSAAERIMEAMEREDIDLIITYGALTTFAGMQITMPSKPVVLGLDLNILTSLKLKDRSFPKEIAFFQSKKSLYQELKTFVDLTKAKNLTIIGDESLIGLPNFPNVRDHFIEEMNKLGVSGEFVSVTDDWDAGFEELRKLKSDGVVFLPTWRLEEDHFRCLVEEVNHDKYPSFSFLGEKDVEEGILMTTTPDSEILRFARRIALNVQEMLLSGSNRNIDPSFSRAKELIINETTANAIGIDLPFSALSIAKMIDPFKVPESMRLSLFESTDIAIRQNLTLEAENYVVESGRQNVIRALSELLPQFNTRTQARRIDRNSALFGRGANPEKLVRTQLDISQPIYDEKRLSNHTIQKYLQKSREYRRDEIELDIIFDTSLAYLLYLRTKAEREIAKENLDLTKANLKRAHELVESGQARLSEVYRWESQLASNREEIVSLDADIENIGTEFNRLLNRPLKIPLELEEIDPSFQGFSLDLANLEKYIGTPDQFDRFKTYMVQLAYNTSPEIKAINQEIYASARKLTETKRAFYLPEVSAFGEFANNVALGGAGSQPPAGLSNSKLERSIGINITYPLFTSGRRVADRNQAYYNLRRTQTDRDVIMQSIGERVIQAIDKMKSSYEGIFLARDAAEAGEKNLGIVTNSYTRGIISIVDLLDAQNTAIVAKQNYSNSIYDYLIDFMELQRAVGQFSHYLSPKDRMLLKQDVIEFVHHKEEL